jgi:ribosomal protein S18 acetylase RimI-like enzyme
VPRSAARVEEVGPFTLFVGTGPWPYYARPRLGLEHEFTRSDVEAVRARQRELGVPEAFEWVHETTPSLLAQMDDVEVLRAPLMVLERPGWRPLETTATIRILGPEDDLATFRAVQDVAFTHGGTDSGPEGIGERDAQERRDSAFVAQRIRERLSVAAVAEIAGGPVAAGMHQPVGGVTEIVGVATLPALRRQGLGGAVTGALVEEALAGGAETVFLSAGSEAVSRVYARLGFRRIGTACIVG